MRCSTPKKTPTVETVGGPSLARAWLTRHLPLERRLPLQELRAGLLAAASPTPCAFPRSIASVGVADFVPLQSRGQRWLCTHLPWHQHRADAQPDSSEMIKMLRRDAEA